MDWVYDLEESTDHTLIARTLDEAAGAYVEAPSAASALAAAEVVAALAGRPGAELPEEVSEWVAAHPADPGQLEALRARAGAMIDRVLQAERSELFQLWDEAGGEDRDTWLAGVADLRNRLT